MPEPDPVTVADGSAAPGQPATIGVGHPPAGRRPGEENADGPSHQRRQRLLLVVGLCAALLIASGYLILNWPGTAGSAPLVVDKTGTVLANQTITRQVEIAANDVTLRHVTIRVGGTAAVRLRPGVTGAVIEDTEIYCTTRATSGIAPGHYSALRVRTHGCRYGFEQNPNAPASIVDSTEDDQPYAAGRESGATDPPSADNTDPGPAGPTPISRWPGPTTTGVPAGTQLTDSGSLTLRTNGQVITNLNITGCVNVYAEDVTIRRSKITCSRTTYSIRTFDTTRNLVVEDTEINGNGKTSATVCCGHYTLRRVNIHHTIDGPRLGTDSTITDSWLHDLVRTPTSHNDITQVTAGSGILLRHNRLDAYRASTQDPMNACLMIGSTSGPTVSNLLFEDNYCNGGNYSIGVRPDLTASNIRFRRNAFGRDYRFGVIARPEQPGISWESGNVWLDNGQPVIE